MIWITQWLCPNQHCAIAVAWDDQETTAEQAERQGEEAFSKGVLNRWCGICGRVLHVEHGRTSFKTMDEALPHLEAIEKANLQTRSIIGHRFFTIKLNPYELGLLHGVMMQLDDKGQLALRGVWEQLIALKKEFEEEAGVTKEMLPGGMLKISDKDGNVIIREPFPWEVEGN